LVWGPISKGRKGVGKERGGESIKSGSRSGKFHYKVSGTEGGEEGLGVKEGDISSASIILKAEDGGEEEIKNTPMVKTEERGSYPGQKKNRGRKKVTAGKPRINLSIKGVEKGAGQSRIPQVS